jgi:hypothetical protein
VSFSSIAIYGTFMSIALHGGKVHVGTWNKTLVALKVLRTDEGAMPNSKARDPALDPSMMPFDSSQCLGRSSRNYGLSNYLANICIRL